MKTVWVCGSVADSAPNTRDLWYSVAWKVDSGFCQNLLGAGFMAGGALRWTPARTDGMPLISGVRGPSDGI
jgi:hypothetical protein